MNSNRLLWLLFVLFGLPLATQATELPLDWKSYYSQAESELASKSPVKAMVDLQVALKLAKQQAPNGKAKQQIRTLLAKAYNVDSDWQSEFLEAEAALRANDAPYALYKCRQSWLAIKDPESNAAAVEKTLALMKEADKELGMEAQGEHDYGKQLTLSEIDNNIIEHCIGGIGSFGEWTVTLDEAKRLNFTGFIPPGGVSVCAFGSQDGQQPSPAQLKKWKEMGAEAEEIQAAKRAKLPLHLEPGSKHYDEVLALSGPISSGQTKPVEFDLTAFVPQEFRLQLP